MLDIKKTNIGYWRKGKSKSKQTNQNAMLTKIFKAKFFLLCGMFSVAGVCFFGAVAKAQAATINAASCEQADVQSAINSSQDGDTVQIPAGECTWGVSSSFVSVNKAITLQGIKDLTIITISDTSGTYGAAAIRNTAGATIRSFTINMAAGTSARTPIICSSADGARITDIIFNGGGQAGWAIYFNQVYGLIDNCVFNGNHGSQELIFQRGPLDSWQTEHSMGMAENLFVEDCEFNGSGYVTDINSNGRAVVRYNTINGQMKVDGHGKSTNTPARSFRHMEIYNNTWTVTSGYYRIMEIRGGTGRIFDNVSNMLSGDATLLVTDYAAFGVYSNFNNQCQCPDFYPIDDQIGVGKDPKVATSEPLYLWNNLSNGKLIIPKIGDWNLTETNPCRQEDQCGFDYTKITQIQEGRDYFNSLDKPEAMKAYIPYTYPHPLRLEDTPIPDPIPGDINGDGIVNIFDYNIFLQHFGVVEDCQNSADLNGDCAVNIFDYNILLENFGRTQ